MNNDEHNKLPTDHIRPHTFDGIQEYDNQLPRWWIGTFVLTVIFSLGYWYHYELSGSGMNQAEAYSEAMQAHKHAHRPKPGSVTTATNDSLLAMAEDPAVLSNIKETYDAMCAACHGFAGEGGIGPNFTDAYWIHGGAPLDIVRVIETGVLEKGMVAWKGVISEEKIQQLAAYILSMQGTTPDNAKAAEGSLYTP